MRVTIAIPFYNTSKFILSTLESIKNQTYSDIELLLYDDFSDDDSSTLVDNWLQLNKSRFSRTNFIKSNLNRGASYATNELFKVSTGTFFQMVGADDILLPSKISNQASFLSQNSQYGMVYSNSYRIDEHGCRLPEDYFSSQEFINVNKGFGPSGYLYEQLLIENFIPASSFLARADVIAQIGGYDPTIRSEDWDLWLRLSKRFQIGFIDSIDVEYRIHKNSSMQNMAYLSKIFSSFVVTLSKHYGSNDHNDKLIRAHIYKYSIGMYRLGQIDLRVLWKNFSMNISFKSLAYLLLGVFKLRINQMN